MLSISKNEAFELRDKYGIKMGENGISRTYTRTKHYYLCERKDNIDALRRLRDSQLAK